MEPKQFQVVFIKSLDGPDTETLTVRTASPVTLQKFITSTWKRLLHGKIITIYVQYCGVISILNELDLKLLYESNAAIETYFMVEVAVLPFGGGIGGGFTTKTPIVASFEVFSNETFENIKLSIENEGEIRCSFALVRNHSDQNLSYAIGVDRVSDFLSCLRLAIKEKTTLSYVVYVMPIHASYSNIVFPQIKACLQFPQLPVLKDIPKNHHKELTALNPSTLTNAINAVKLEFPHDSIAFQKSKGLVSQMLQLICSNTAPKEKFNEKLRRSIIDIPLHVALGFVNSNTNLRRELTMEEVLFNENNSGINNPSEIVGTGPLDYLIPDGVIVTSGDFDDSQDEGGVEKLEFTANTEFALVDIEAKADLEDKYLYQILAQLHDAMYVHDEIPKGIKRTLVGDTVAKGRLALSRSKAIGILTTGHTWEVYTVNHNSVNNTMEVYYHGKRVMKVLRYLPTTNRTSSFKVNPNPNLTEEEEIKEVIEDGEVEEVLYLILAVLFNKL